MYVNCSIEGLAPQQIYKILGSIKEGVTNSAWGNQGGLLRGSIEGASFLLSAEQTVYYVNHGHTPYHYTV